LKKNLALVEKLKEVAATKQCTPAQLCLAWILHKGEDMFPIPGTKRENNARDNNDSIQVTLSAADLHEITQILDQIPVVGGRYDDNALKLIAQAF